MKGEVEEGMVEKGSGGGGCGRRWMWGEADVGGGGWSGLKEEKEMVE